jgi:ribosomal protein S19E (S16A)
VSKDYTNEIGYETLLSDFKRYQKQTPRGVGMAKKGQNIYLQFKTPNTARKQYACGCSFTLDGMVDALRKSNKVAEALKSFTSETEFWQWYDKEIKQESQLADDQITFGEAIAKVEDDFWSRLSRTKRKREKGSPSDEDSWYRTYGCFYKHLPLNSVVSLEAIQKVISMQAKGSSNLTEVVRAMKKLAALAKKKDIVSTLEAIDTTQTKYIELQSVTLKDFIDWRDRTLGLTASLPTMANIKSRKAWMWTFSVQMIYALRINEVFAIKNLTEPYKTKDGVVIPALNNPDNTSNLIYIGDRTILGTTVKTGHRIARPNIPPTCPDLIERLEIKMPLLPDNKPKSKSSSTIRRFYAKTAREQLIRWNAPFTQTHADRHLGNINGMQAGISQEVRAQSMGHTPAMNDSVYKKRQSTQTTIDLLLNSNQSAIDFVTALAEAKKLVKENESDKEIIARLLSIIYQKNEKDINKLL